MKKSTFLRSLLTLLVMAVWGTSAMAQTITDELTLSTFGVSGTTYTSVTGKKSNSDAVYSAQMAGGYDAIQLRSSNSNSGIVTTASGGNVKSITITWNSNTNTARKIDVYGKNTAFTAPTELYNTTSEVTKLGTLSYSATANTLEISGDYQYIGIRSNSRALYLDKVEIVWYTNAVKSCIPPTFSTNGGIVEKNSTVSLDCMTEGAKIYYALNADDPETAEGTEYTDPITIDKDYSITAWAKADGMDASERVTRRFTTANPIWKEDFSSNSIDNYTIENGGGTTKLYEETLAGGEAPEILIAKSGGSLTVSNIDLNGYFGTFLLTFNSNKDGSDITSTATGVKVKKIDYTNPNGVYEVYVPEGTTSLDLKISNPLASNMRVDNILLWHKYDLQTLNISSVGYATFCTDKNFIMPADVEGGIVTVDGTAANVNYAYAYKDNIFASDIVPANTGLLMKGEAREYKMYATTQEATEVYAENLLKGALTNDPITAPADSLLYIFANDSESGLGFYWQNNSNPGQQVQNMKGKAYLQVPTTSAVKGFRLNLGDTTGITAVESTLGNAPVYTLSGVRVNGSLNNLPAGIYIVGGKKVYVK